MSQLVQSEEYLTQEEENELLSLENDYINFGNHFLESARKAGEVLDKIQKSNYFKKKRKSSDFPPFQDFGSYCKERFGKGKTTSYNYIHIFRLMNALDIAGYNSIELGSIQNAMQVYSELKRLGEYKDGVINPLFRDVLSKAMIVAENISTINYS